MAAETEYEGQDRGLKLVYELFIDNQLYAPVPNFLCYLFDKLVQPALLYGSEVWGFHSALDVERVHFSFCKRILQVKRSTANSFIYEELGRFQLQITSKRRILKY